MSIFVSWRGCDRDVKNELVAALREQLPGEEIWESDEGCVSNAYEDFIRKIHQSEVFIVIVSDEAMKPSYVINEVIAARNCEMAGTLNMLVFKITDSPYTPTLEANLNHLSDANHVARLHGSDEGYRTLANRVRTLLERRRSGDPEDPYDTFVPQLRGTDISAGYYVPHSRDRVFEAFDQAFERSNVIVAAQVDGYGKKCAARQYALLNREQYKQKIVLHDFSGSLREFFINGIVFTNIGKTAYESMSENDVILHKARLLQKLGKDTLILVPELIPDARDDRFVLDALEMIGCRVIFVTQAMPQRLRGELPVISVDRLEDAHLKELFFHFYEASEEEQEALSDCLTAFFDSIEGHTKSVEATANFLADEFGIYPEDVPEILQNICPDSSNALSERIFSLLSDIFDMKKFGEEERKMLLAAAYFARIPMDEKLFVKLLEAGGCYDGKKLRALVDRGWLDSDRATRTISIGGFFADVCLAKNQRDEQLLCRLFRVMYEQLVDQSFDISLGSVFTMLKRMGRFCGCLGQTALMWACEQYSRVLENAAMDLYPKSAEVARYQEQANDAIAEQFYDPELQGVFREFSELVFGLIRLGSAMWTPTESGESVSSAQRMSALLLYDGSMMDMLKKAMEGVEDPVLKKLLHHMKKGVESGNFASFIQGFERAVEQLLDMEEQESEDIAEIYSVLCILAESLTVVIKNTPYLVQRICKAWYQLVQRIGVLSYSRAYIMYAQYFEALCDLEIYTEELDEICQQLMFAMENAEKEGYFLQSGGIPKEEQEVDFSARFLYALQERGELEDAARLLVSMAKGEPKSENRIQQSLKICVHLLRKLIRRGDTEFAQEMVAEVLSALPRSIREKPEQAPEEIGELLEEIHFFCEAMELSGQEESFRDQAEEYLDYYRKFAKEFSDKRLMAKYEQIATQAKALDFSRCSREELQQRVAQLQRRAAQGEKKESLAPEAFALVSEAGYRTLGYRHHHVQYMGGAAIADGKIAEIQNGEGKTYTILLPAFLYWLYGKQVYIIDSSPYLTQRNYHWMKGVLQYLGCAHYLAPEEKMRKPKWDTSVPTIVYITERVLIFAYLRSELKGSTAALPMDVAIVDEAEQLMVASGAVSYCLSESVSAPNAPAFVKAVYDVVANIPQESASQYFARNSYGGITVKPALYEALETLLIQRDLQPANYQTKLEQYLRACIHVLYFSQRDMDYYVVDGTPKGENKTTGSFFDFAGYYTYFVSRKERLDFDYAQLEETKVSNVITFRELAGYFGFLAGTTATASSMESAFRDVYKLDVVPIPTNIPVKRINHPPVVFTGKASKLKAILALVAEKHQADQPVLVVTDSIYESVEISQLLQQAKIPHKLLNARNADQDADTLEYAGCLGAVTVTTALANRGVDIRLGGNPKTFAKAHLLEAGFPLDEVLSAAAGNTSTAKEVALKKKLEDLTAFYRQKTDAHRAQINQLGGLCVIGTSCFQDLRTEQQMRGRCGRQGDEGESYVFFATVDESLKVLMGQRYEALRALYERMGLGDDCLGSSAYMLNPIERARTMLLNNTCKAFLNQPAMGYRPAARAAILGKIEQLETAEETTIKGLLRQYFAGGPKNAESILQLARTGNCPDRDLMRLQPFMNLTPRLKEKQIPQLLTEALSAYYRDLGDRAPEQSDVARAMQYLLAQSWSDYLVDMERESNEAKAFCRKQSQYEKHLKKYSEQLCETLLERAVTTAVLVYKKEE